MALVPLKQTITVYPPDNDDPWNQTPPGEPFTLRCRFQESVEVVTDTHGREAISSAHVFLDKFAPVDVGMTFEYEDETGTKRRYSVINIDRKRWLNGKAILTVVYLR